MWLQVVDQDNLQIDVAFWWSMEHTPLNQWCAQSISRILASTRCIFGHVFRRIHCFGWHHWTLQWLHWAWHSPDTMNLPQQYLMQRRKEHATRQWIFKESMARQVWWFVNQSWQHFSRGADQYPKDLDWVPHTPCQLSINQDACDKATARQTRWITNGNELTFAQVGTAVPGTDRSMHANIQSFSCKNKGHYVNMCPKDKEVQQFQSAAIEDFGDKECSVEANFTFTSVGARGMVIQRPGCYWTAIWLCLTSAMLNCWKKSDCAPSHSWCLPTEAVKSPNMVTKSIILGPCGITCSPSPRSCHLQKCITSIV